MLRSVARKALVSETTDFLFRDANPSPSFVSNVANFSPRLFPDSNLIY